MPKTTPIRTRIPGLPPGTYPNATLVAMGGPNRRGHARVDDHAFIVGRTPHEFDISRDGASNEIERRAYAKLLGVDLGALKAQIKQAREADAAENARGNEAYLRKSAAKLGLRLVKAKAVAK